MVIDILYSMDMMIGIVKLKIHDSIYDDMIE
jgi:hypothetical protein